VSIINKNFIKYLIPFIVSTFILILSFYSNEWINFWNFLNVPAQYPPFADFDAINKALLSKQQGFDPYVENPNDIQNPKYMYPSIWLHIFEILNLKNILYLKVSNFLIIYLYIYVLIDFTEKINTKNFLLIITLFFLSTSNFLILERLNIEIIIFILLYFSLINKNIFVKSFLFLLSIILKLFPIFSAFSLIDRKKSFVITLLISLIYFYISRNEILIMRSNMVEYALIFAYGVGSISKAIYHYSTEFNYFINDNNYFVFRNIMILLAITYAISIFLIKFKFKQNKINKYISFKEKFFLAGAGIYIGTFCTSANIDYRLLFLIFTVPYILEKNQKNVIKLYCLSLILCFNSLIFEGGNSYSFIYFAKASIIYFFKLIIFTLNCYYFGEILNNYLNIKFTFLKIIKSKPISQKK